MSSRVGLRRWVFGAALRVPAARAVPVAHPGTGRQTASPQRDETHNPKRQAK
jgi:hypothetical protein